MKNLVFGILAHVDAGKTTLSEAMLYHAGILKNPGRVDNRDTMLDSNEMERARGITIFSKQAHFEVDNTHITLLDTPGHVDFSAEMERTLSVLDYAILVISATDGVQGHTRTLWKLFDEYKIPVFIFVNKMDQHNSDKAEILTKLQAELSEGCVDLSASEAYEEIAVVSGDEKLLEYYLSNGTISKDVIINLIGQRKIFPCYFGSALKLYGVSDLLDGIDIYTKEPSYGEKFGARVYKITRDPQGNRLTHMKITGGKLTIKCPVTADEKVNQIRIYNGDKYDNINEIGPGHVCAVTGLNSTRAGDGLGFESDNDIQLIEPVLTYKLSLPDNMSSRKIYPEMKCLEEELPELCVNWNEEAEEITVKLMGLVQIEILTSLINKRFGFEPIFGTGTITYKETISNTVIGVGHFEPLRHYAEVHLLMEPAEPGTGIILDTNCSEDVLERNWQRLILTHLKEKKHLGVLTGSALTDVKITVINGRAHQKHTEGGDFRQATYRAVRQGLMQAEAVLLEPYYNFRIEIPSDMVGRVMTDIETMHATINPPDITGDYAVIKGYGPVATMRDYQINLNAYTRGCGNIFVSFRGYDICHNQDEVVSQINYNPDNDLKNPSSSVFCAHGSGFIVPWYEVPEYMHVSDETETDIFSVNPDLYKPKAGFDYSIDLEEIDAIFSRTFNANIKSDKHDFKKKKTNLQYYTKTNTGKINPSREKMLIVDGYNVIFAWEELKSLAGINIDSAKDRLIHILSNYYGITGEKLLLVFDGYKLKGNYGSNVAVDDIEIVHTKEGETADQYIEKYTYTNADKYDITVATSDGLIQTICRSKGCRILSSRELLDIIEVTSQKLRDEYHID